MNITEFMDFDLAWFTTLPGILITGGVIVLLIALIVFIASNKKDKNKTADVASVDNSRMSPVMDNSVGMPLGEMNSVPVDNGVMMNNDVQSQDFNFSNNLNNMSNFNNVNSVNSTDMSSATNSSVEVPTVPSYEKPAVPNNVVDFSVSSQSPINDIPTIPTVNSTIDSNVVTPTINNNNNNNLIVDTPVGSSITSPNTTTATAIPEVNSQRSLEPATPAVSNAVEPGVPTVSNSVTPVQETVAMEKPTIYGGVDPANTVHTTAEVKPVIYGGANPLENTTTIPTMTNHEAYNISSNVNPNVSEIPMTPSESTVPSSTVSVVPETMPAVESVTPSVMPQTEPSVAPTVMPMTGAEMFGSNDNGTIDTNVNSEIETLEF